MKPFFLPINSYPMQYFDGSCFLIPVRLMPEKLAKQMAFKTLGFDYYLAFGRIESNLELLMAGMVKENPWHFEAEEEEGYFVPLSLLSETPAWKLPHFRMFHRDPYILSLAHEFLKRRGQAAQRFDRDLDPLRIPNYPDSVLVLADLDGRLRALAVDRLKLIGPDLFSGLVHDDAASELSLKPGETVYLRKVRSLDEKGGETFRLHVLEQKPLIPKADILYDEPAEGLALWRGVCGKCNKDKFRWLGEEKLDAETAGRYKQEIMAGLWGMELYGFALQYSRVRLKSSRAYYYCTECGSGEVHRCLRLEAESDEETLKQISSDRRSHAEYLPRCSVCGMILEKHEGPPQDITENCRKCKAPYIWQELSADELREQDPAAAEVPYMPEDFDRLSLKEAALLSFDYER